MAAVSPAPVLKKSKKEKEKEKNKKPSEGRSRLKEKARLKALQTAAVVPQAAMDSDKKLDEPKQPPQTAAATAENPTKTKKSKKKKKISGELAAAMAEIAALKAAAKPAAAGDAAEAEMDSDAAAGGDLMHSEDVEALEKAKAEAAAAEDYEGAAVLKRRIEALGGACGAKRRKKQ